MTQEETSQEETAVAEVQPEEIIDTATVCYRHPQTETSLRCTRCDRYICSKCALRTPVGYICPECQRAQEDRFFSGKLSDYGIAAIIAFPLSLIAAFIFTAFLGRLGFFLFFIGFIAAGFAGGLIAEAVRWGVQKRRSRYLGRVTAACLVVATLPFIIFLLFTGGIFALLGPGLLLFVGSSTILARLR